MNWEGRKRELVVFLLWILVFWVKKDHSNLPVFSCALSRPIYFNLSYNQNNGNMIFLFMVGDGISWDCRTKRSVWSLKMILRKVMLSLMKVLKCQVFCSKSFSSMCHVFFPFILSSSHCVQINILGITQQLPVGP